jgi:hypothetical protein
MGSRTGILTTTALTFALLLETGARAAEPISKWAVR